MPMIDLNAVKAAIPLSTVLQILGRLPRLYTRTQFSSYCPLGCHGHKACGFNLAKSVWHCFKCNKGGNQLDLYMLLRRMTVHQAALDLCEKCGVTVPMLKNPPPACLREPKESATVTEEGSNLS